MSPRGNGPVRQPEDRSAQLVSWTLDDVQHTWETLLPQQTGKDYRRAKLVLFRRLHLSGCGTAQSQTGPFYCPADEKVYIDLSFWDELRRLGGSNAEFAQAYVVAHELGHHVQNILGIEQTGTAALRPGSFAAKSSLRRPRVAGRLSRRRVGARHRAAQHFTMPISPPVCKQRRQLGDDHLQRMERGAVSPESFTHGSSAQRVGWFKRGLQQGTIAACNTFKAGGAVPRLTITNGSSD